MNLDTVDDKGPGPPLPASFAARNPTVRRSTSTLTEKITEKLAIPLYTEDSLPPEHWAHFRRIMFSCAQTHAYECCISALVIFNLILVVLETDATTDGRQAPEWMTGANDVLMVIYCVEIILRLYVWRKTFFSSIWNVMDFVVISTDVAFWCYFTAIHSASNLGMVKCLRLVRLLRLSQSIKLLVNFPDLVLALKGLVGAFVAATWGMLLLLFTMMLFSILTVLVLHPVAQELGEDGTYMHCDRCGRAYESVMASMLTITQAYLAGDSWGVINLPILERAPYTAPLYIGIAIVVDLMILNMILAFIVDSNASARKGAEHEIAICIDRGRREAAKKFAQMCESMDTDSSGELSMSEVITAFDENSDFADILKALGVVKEDMKAVFHMLDTDDSGQVDFQEFAAQLYKMKSSDTQVLLCFIRMHVSNISKMVKALLQESNAILRDELAKILQVDTSTPSDDLSASLHVAELKRAEALLANSKPLQARLQISKSFKRAKTVRSNSLPEAHPPAPERPLHGNGQDCPLRSRTPGAEMASHAQRELPPREVPGGDLPPRAYPELLASLDCIRAELSAAMQDATPMFKETTRLLKSLNERLPGVLDSEGRAAVQSCEEASLKGSTWSRRPAECARGSFQGALLEPQRPSDAAGSQSHAPDSTAGSGRGRVGGLSGLSIITDQRASARRPGALELGAGPPPGASGPTACVNPDSKLTHASV